MTPKQRTLVYGLIVKLDGHASTSNAEVLRCFRATDGIQLSQDLLRDATSRRHEEDVALALVVAFTFGFTEGHLEALLALATADWHRSHEDVATAFARLADPVSVAALTQLATWVPDYLDWDEHRALAVKAVWALGAIQSEHAKDALRSIEQSRQLIVSTNAKAQL